MAGGGSENGASVNSGHPSDASYRQCVLSSPLAKWANPGWIGFHTPDEFRHPFLDAGFARAAWIDL